MNMKLSLYMKKNILFALLLSTQAVAGPVRDTLSLNGTWQFDQTEKAFPARPLYPHYSGAGPDSPRRA